MCLDNHLEYHQKNKILTDPSTIMKLEDCVTVFTYNIYLKETRVILERMKEDLERT